MFGSSSDRLFDSCYRLLGLALVVEGHTEIIEGKGVVGFVLDRLLELFNGLPAFPFRQVNAAGLDMSFALSSTPSLAQRKIPQALRPELHGEDGSFDQVK